jgi:flagellar protein FliL
MSAATTATDTPPEPKAPGKGKKKLIIIIAAVAVLVAGGGGAAVFMMKKKAANAEAEAEGENGKPAPVKAVSKADPKTVPAFVPLDPFTVNLADRDADRYAQIGITLEIDDVKLADQIKNYMPAIRNNILLAIADRTAGDLLGRDGKSNLAERVRVETSRAMGYELPGDKPEAKAPAKEAAADEDDGEEKKPKKKAKAKVKPEVLLPIKAVHFSNFIIQ